MHVIDKVLSGINLTNFSIPTVQGTDDYFPEYLERKLNDFISYYENSLIDVIDAQVLIKSDRTYPVFERVREISNAINSTVKLYYEGRIFEASENFNKALGQLYFDKIKPASEIEERRNFYRARRGENKHFTKHELFHVPFELRSIVSTNRYSIPGFPALYLCDSCYACWEELDRFRLRDLWFARFSNNRKLKIIQIQRIEDFLSELKSVHDDLKVTYILRYVTLFPIILACTIKVKNPLGNFKPEYIIPQLLLQYISKSKELDGIKFPSTRIDYLKLKGVSAYNYVFPVKLISKDGFCTELMKIFSLTEPTSLEMEEIIYNPKYQTVRIGENMVDESYIELIGGYRSKYQDTSFGRLEGVLSFYDLDR